MAYNQILTAIPQLVKKNGYTQNGNRASGTEEKQMHEEVASLRRELKDVQATLVQRENQMELCKVRTRQLADRWQLDIQEANEKLRRQRQERDHELEEITTQLLFFETHLKKEQSEIQRAISEKDKVIRHQQNRLRVLESRNAELELALRETKKMLPNGLRVSFSPNETSFSRGNSSRDGVHNNSVTSPRDLTVNGSLNSSFDGCMVTRQSNVSGSRHTTSSNGYSTNSLPGYHHQDSGYSDTFDSLPVGRTINAERGSNDVYKYTRSTSIPDLPHTDSHERRTLNKTENPSRGRETGLRTKTRSYPNLNASGTEGLEKDHSLHSSIGNVSCFSLEFSELSNDRFTGAEQAPEQKTPVKSESPRDRTKRSFLRPRDVKKKSQLRSRSNSLKESEQKALAEEHKHVQNKRFFSFAF